MAYSQRFLKTSLSCVLLFGLSACAEKPDPYVRRTVSDGQNVEPEGNGEFGGTNPPGSGGTGSGNGGGTMPTPSPTAPPTPSPTPPVLGGGSPATGSVSLTYTTVAPSPGGRYTPRHVQAIFVTDMNDRLIRSISAAPGNANGPAAPHLKRWRFLTNGTADGLSGATLPAYGAGTPVTWDLKTKDGTIVPQGNYKIWFELSEANTTASIGANGSISTATPITGIDTVAGYRAHSIVITLGPQSSTKTDNSNPVWSNISVTHTP